MTSAETKASQCMKCGFCMSNCPVYSVDHIESHVARGRNVLVRWAEQGAVLEDDDYGDRLSYCLLCGRCQSVCPANVPSPEITVEARANMLKKQGLSLPKKLVYRGILQNRPLMARLLGVTARVPGMSAKDGTPLRHLPDFVSVFSRGLSIPILSRPFLSKRLPAKVSPTGGKVLGQVAIFPGCAFEFFMAEAGEAMVSALVDAGFEVIYPEGLTCCGLAVRSAGDIETARRMAKRNIEVLSQFDRVITGCATCSSTLKDYGKWFGDDDLMQEQAKKFSAKVSELTQFLAKSGYQPPPREPITVTYHDPCHLKWRQGIDKEPRQLLRSIEGMNYVEMEGAGECCGLGGAFSIAHRDTSLVLQARKMESIAKTGAQVVVTACPGCIVQLRDGARRHKLPVEVIHISQLIRGQKALPRKRR